MQLLRGTTIGLSVMKGVSMSGVNIGITSAFMFIMAEEATTIGGVTGTPMVTMTGGATSIRIINLPGES